MTSNSLDVVQSSEMLVRSSAPRPWEEEVQRVAERLDTMLAELDYLTGGEHLDEIEGALELAHDAAVDRTWPPEVAAWFEAVTDRSPKDFGVVITALWLTRRSAGGAPSTVAMDSLTRAGWTEPGPDCDGWLLTYPDHWGGGRSV